jgi:hypothetical protein
MCSHFKELVREGIEPLIVYLQSRNGPEIFSMIQHAVDLLQSDDFFFCKPQMYEKERERKRGGEIVEGEGRRKEKRRF